MSANLPPQSLTWVYPNDGHTTAETSVLLVGQVPAGQTVTCTVNGEVIDTFVVSGNGYLGGHALLKVGDNSIALALEDGERLVRTVTRLAKAAPTEATMVFPAPSQRIAGVAGTIMPLVVHTPVDWRVGVYWEGQSPLLLQSLGPADALADTRSNVFGQLHWSETAPVHAACVHAGQLQLVAGMQSVTVVGYPPEGEPQRMATLAVTVWPQPQWGVVVVDTVCRVGPAAATNRLSPLLPGTELPVVAVLGDWVAVTLTDTLMGWLPAETIDVTPELPRAPVPIRLATVTPSDDAQTLSLPLPWLPPIQWQTSPDGIEVAVGHATAQYDVIAQPSQDEFKLVTTSSSTVQTAWHTPQLAGISMSATPMPDAVAGVNWHCQARFFPEDRSAWRILLDPGHGGDETGAIAPNGQPEAALNLTIALACQQALQSAGFQQVELTRTGNTTVSLADRVQQAERFEPHLCLSLHHNALPDGRDPRQHRGLSTFYYHGHARPLAQHLLASLSSRLNLPTDGLYWDNLAMTRIHTAAAVLIEWGYLTHPEDAERLLAGDFPHQAAQVLVTALETFTP